jgi:predicted transcriptional regulator
MSDLTAEDVLEAQVVTLAPEVPIGTAIRTLVKKELSGAPVVGEGQKLLGFLSEKDCLRILTAEAFDGAPQGRVSDYMTTEVMTIKRETSLFDIVSRFLGSPFKRLPVTDSQGRLAGLVSRRGVLRAIDSMQDNSYLYGSADKHPPTDDAHGVDSAMRRARGA